MEIAAASSSLEIRDKDGRAMTVAAAACCCLLLDGCCVLSASAVSPEHRDSTVHQEARPGCRSSGSVSNRRLLGEAIAAACLGLHGCVGSVTSWAEQTSGGEKHKGWQKDHGWHWQAEAEAEAGKTISQSASQSVTHKTNFFKVCGWGDRNKTTYQGTAVHTSSGLVGIMFRQDQDRYAAQSQALLPCSDDKVFAQDAGYLGVLSACFPAHEDKTAQDGAGKVRNGPRGQAR